MAQRVNLGSNSGLSHNFTDSSVVDGIEYTYVVTAYDMGLRTYTTGYFDDDGDGKPEIYGFLSRGWGRLTTASFASYLFNHGGSWFKTAADGTKVANINSKESVDAFEFLSLIHI